MLKKFSAIFVLFTAIVMASQPSAAKKLEVITLAGGCFWCVESDFDNVPGVVKTVSGYTGGKGANPNYNNYISKGHIEAVQITFDPTKTSYSKLLDVFWHSVDPTDPGGQFCDRGHGYITGIFARGAKQKTLAQQSRAKLVKANPGKKIVTKIYQAGKFYPAEAYHQGYAARNPLRYSFYRRSCGRDGRVKRLWGAKAHRGIKAH